ncbi:MAG: hypothetical protein V4733_01930 [Verrucomicrobiota bacterium]
MKYSAVALAAVFLTACSTQPEVKRDPAGNEIPEPFIEVGGQASATDIARFLGGRPVRQGAILSRMQQSGEYAAYSRDTLSKWRSRTERRMIAQNNWQATYIRPLAGTSHTLLYPFGGPDLLYAMSVFPNSSRYILLGLEPVGSVPALEFSDPGSVFTALPRHAKSIETQLLYGYFITKDMRAELANGPLQGVTPVMLTALGLMSAEIHNVRSINAGGNPGVEIDFTLPQWGRKSAVYIAGDLSNSGFRGGYSSWLSSQASGSTVYFKAASYLMHDSGFSSMKNWVLSNARSVVQDDSGIPYSSFDQNTWQISLFGRYEAPIALFAKHHQPSLRAAYDAAGPVPSMTYGSGYHMKYADANLLVATRK